MGSPGIDDGASGKVAIVSTFNVGRLPESDMVFRNYFLDGLLFQLALQRLTKLG